MGGALFNKGTLTLTHCTVAGNSATGPGIQEGGGIYNEFVACTLNNSIVAGNTAASGFGAQILQDGGTLTRLGANLVSGLVAGTDLFGGAVLAGSGTVSNATPDLSALASNGGPTKTMLPNAGSPAIDAAVDSSTAADQRGLSRPQGGAADIGAVEVASLIVQNNDNSGPGSLRQTIADAAFVPGGVLTRVITFAPALSGQTITLTSGELTPGHDLTIDASALANAITLTVNNNYRVFFVSVGRTVVFRALRVVGGNGNGYGDGGGILNQGTATLEQCTLSGNTANVGGGIANFGTLTLTQSTLSGNTSLNSGGGISNLGILTLTQSTLSGNSAYVGGGIDNLGILTRTQSTLAGNSANFNGGGIYNPGGTLTLTRTIVAGNTASDAFGANIYGPFSGSNNLTDGNPLLAPLGNSGGPTQTMPPLPGSPAIDAGGSTTETTDQRGLPRVVNVNGSAIVDIGAVELQVRLVTTAADENDGLGVGGVSLREAMADTSGGSDIIRFAPALSGQTITLGSEIVINGTAAITVDASSLPGGLTLTDTGNVSHRLLSTSTGTHLALRGLTLANGGGTNFGGGGGSIHNQGSLTLTDCTISGSIANAGYGGAIFNSNPTQTAVLSLTDCTLANNNALAGGAIFNDSSLTLARCTLSGNSASQNGGGISNSGTLTLAQSTLSGNSASSNGGGIFNDFGTVNLTKSTLSGNSASEGGGIRNSGTVTLNQSTLSGNSASDDGGGIYNDFGTVTLTQSTLSGNSASTFGGGIFSNNGPVTLTQSTLSGNSASINGGGIYIIAGTVTLTRSIVARNTATTSANIVGSFSGSNNLTSGNPLLAPLGNYGGPTQTMPPLPGSPAIDAGGSTTDTTDQRGAPRVADGDGNGSAIVDIGAVEAIPAIVTILADSGAGSLRAALMAPSTDIVLFHPSLGGQTITLTTGQITPGRGLGIDATTVPGGITISGNSDGDNVPEAGESRLFEIPAGVAVTLRGLHLTNGIADPASDVAPGEGGAIRNSGQLTLDLCAISNCRSKRGGAINSTGVLTVGRSTFQQNNATFGGAIHSTGNGLLTVADSTFLMNTALLGRGGAVLENDVDSPPGHPTLTRCTFHGNAASLGGAVDSFSLTNLTHCTLTGNSASNMGGGVLASATSVVKLTNCVVAGNSNGSSPDLGIEGNGVLSTSGVNLVGNLTGSGFSAGPTLLTGDPLLAPIASYGGPTPTRALLPGSPARDATTFVVDSADQRGFPIVGLRDLGAYEAGTLSNFEAFAIETPGAALSPTGDADFDGRSDLLEYATQSDPNAPSNGEITPTTYNQNAAGAITQANVTFPTRVGATDLTYTLQRSTTLTGGWTTVATWNATTGVLTQASGVSASRHPGTGLVSVTDTNVNGEDNAFFRLDVQQVP